MTEAAVSALNRVKSGPANVNYETQSGPEELQGDKMQDF